MKMSNTGVLNIIFTKFRIIILIYLKTFLTYIKKSFFYFKIIKYVLKIVKVCNLLPFNVSQFFYVDIKLKCNATNKNNF